MLKVKKDALSRMIELAQRDYPYETCGLMLGKSHRGVREVYEVFPTPNANKERKHDRYEIDPKDYMRAEDYALKKGLEIVGVYHSHPEHPDRPSEFDRVRAFPDLSYIIFSVKDGKVVSYRSWELVGDRFEEERIEVTD
ncbi:MAG: M67 family metallopeptidase [Aquificae bacterium]|nr:M67 family metallopeptidase [Aquificota bacterium]